MVQCKVCEKASVEVSGDNPNLPRLWCYDHYPVAKTPNISKDDVTWVWNEWSMTYEKAEIRDILFTSRTGEAWLDVVWLKRGTVQGSSGPANERFRINSFQRHVIFAYM